MQIKKTIQIKVRIFERSLMSTEEATIFKNFVLTLDDLTGLSSQKIENALEICEGLSGVLREEWFILGYEQLGWLLAEELTTEEIKAFGSNNAKLLTQDTGAMYFFTQALMEKSDISNDERLNLIYSMPEQYHKYLLMRFGFRPIP